MRQRVAAAQTAEEQLAMTFDWFRMSAAHIKDAAERATQMREVSSLLASRASEIDGSRQ